MTDFKMGRTKTLSTASVSKIAEYFGVSTDFLLTGEEDQMKNNCKECGFSLQPWDKEDHKRFHEKWQKAVEKFEFCWNYKQREARYDAEAVMQDESKSFLERYKAAITILMSYFSRSLEGSDYNLSHIQFYEYVSYFLHSQKHVFPNDIYDELVEVYGVTPGMYGTYWECDGEDDATATPTLTPRTKEVVRKYEKCDNGGKEMVDRVLDYEYHRTLKLQPAQVPDVPRTAIPVYTTPAAAGRGCYLSGDDCDEMDFPASDIPHGADFGVRIKGDSMEPKIPDGCIVFVKSAPSPHYPGAKGRGSGWVWGGRGAGMNITTGIIAALRINHSVRHLTIFTHV